jgi:glycosyltransferase involved in cell wall biosynthesis
MRITFVVVVADLSGGFRVVATYAERLRQRGHEVLVMSCARRKPTLKDRLRALIKRRPVRLTPENAPTHLDDTQVAHKKLEARRPPTADDLPDADVIIATWWETAEWVWALPASKGVKVHFMQDYEVWGNSPVHRVDATCVLPMPKVTPARWVKDLLEKEFGQTAVTCVPNAVDLAKFTAPPRGKQTVPTVGFTYTAFRNKGTDITIEAIRLARQQRPELRVVAFGATKPLPELPLPSNTAYHPRAPEQKLKELYGQCDAWLFGTRKEGFGLPILEAMACRTPVIGTPAGAAPELLEPGGGMMIPMEAPRAMADAILKVCSMHATEWRAMSDAAHATATRYTWDDATDQFEAALVRAVEAAGAAGGATPAGRNPPTVAAV